MKTIRALTTADINEFREIRLLALQQHPTAYASSFEEEENFTQSDWEKRVGLLGSDDFVVGAFLGNRLLGVSGFFRLSRRKQRHKGYIWGVYVSPELRGQGIGRDLLLETLARAEKISGLEVIQLSVEEENLSAYRLYLRQGFVEYGREPMASRVQEDSFVNDRLMWKRVSKAQ